jgi:hypothetical protein
MPWDSPNRILGFAYLPLPWKSWSVSVLADAHTGFPFSVEQVTGVVTGRFDSYRYPFNFDLNVAIERVITLRGRRFALRLGANNVTDSRSPTSVRFPPVASIPGGRRAPFRGSDSLLREGANEVELMRGGGSRQAAASASCEGYLRCWEERSRREVVTRYRQIAATVSVD